jgi:hypothetical protein
MKTVVSLASILGIAVMGVAFVGCDSATNDTTPPPDTNTPVVVNATTVTVTAVDAESGSIWQNGTVYTDVAAVGDSAGTDLGICGFVSFNIDAIPVDAEIVSASMNLNHYVINPGEQNPFTPPSPLGNFMVYAQNYGALEAGDYNAATYALLYDAAAGGAALGAIDITGALRAALNNSFARFQIRLQFATQSNGDGLAQLARFDDTLVRMTVVYR